MTAKSDEPEPAKGAAAFFDLDKTLIAGSSLVGMAKGLQRRDLCDAGTVAQLRWQHLRGHLERAAQASGPQDSPGGVAMSWVQGRSRAEVEAVTDEIVKECIAPRVYTEMAALVTQHGRDGLQTFVATAAPAEVAATVARGLGMTGGLGTMAETDDAGRYSGRANGAVLHGEAKAAAVAAHAASVGIDLAASVAYADSMADAPLLELFGRAEVVNPDAPLRRLASQKGWPIHQPRTTVDDLARHRIALVGRRLAEHGLDGYVTPDALTETGRNRHYVAADPDAFVRAVEATHRFRRDTRIGALYHPGRISLREVTAGTSLHLTVAGDRVAVHVDQVSPLATRQPENGCRYSVSRIAAHNLTGIAGDVARVLRRREQTECGTERNG